MLRRKFSRRLHVYLTGVSILTLSQGKIETSRWLFLEAFALFSPFTTLASLSMESAYMHLMNRILCCSCIQPSCRAIKDCRFIVQLTRPSVDYTGKNKKSPSPGREIKAINGRKKSRDEKLGAWKVKRNSSGTFPFHHGNYIEKECSREKWSFQILAKIFNMNFGIRMIHYYVSWF